MAIFQCDYQPHRYPQAQQSIYYTVVFGSEQTTTKSRLCPTHFRASCVTIGERMSLIDDDSQTSADCDSCHAPKVGALYAKVFPAKEEAAYWVVDVCQRCMTSISDELRIAQGNPMTAR